MFKYRTWSAGIDKVECRNETEKFVTLINGNRTSKQSSLFYYFDTYKEAKDYLIKKALANVDYIKMQLESTYEDLKKMQSLKE